jgi:hypothetical protein
MYLRFHFFHGETQPKSASGNPKVSGVEKHGSFKKVNRDAQKRNSTSC